MGAVGDGSHDDTDAIQACLDASLSVYFPPGKYKVTIPANSTRGYALLLKSGHHIFGDGYASWVAADFPPVTVPLTPPYFNVFHFEGNGSTDKRNGNDAVAESYRGIFFGELGDGQSASDEIRGNTIIGHSAENAARGILVGGSGQEIDIRDNRIV
jgi:polygalacturonase